jgi:hypothetical protein
MAWCLVKHRDDFTFTFTRFSFRFLIEVAVKVADSVTHVAGFVILYSIHLAEVSLMKSGSVMQTS